MQHQQASCSRLKEHKQRDEKRDDRRCEARGSPRKEENREREVRCVAQSQRRATETQKDNNKLKVERCSQTQRQAEGGQRDPEREAESDQQGDARRIGQGSPHRFVGDSPSLGVWNGHFP